MPLTDTFLDRDAGRQNNFGVMRLILAMLVVLSHMFPAYGHGIEFNEVLLLSTHQQMDLGALAVNAFFAISGYLIALSWLRTPRFGTFMAKRALRIYPGFIVCSIVSLLVVAPLAGIVMSEAFAPKEIIKAVGRLVFLSAPKALAAFHGEPKEVLNMSLWTIRYEFICYLLVPLLLAMFRFGRVGLLVLYTLFLVWHASQGRFLVEDRGFEIPIIGHSEIWPRFLVYFVGGMAFALNRDRIPFRRWIALACLGALMVTAFITGGFFVATATAGIYLLFYLAYQTRFGMHALCSKTDVSYGVYLYGWPVQMLLIYYLRDYLNVWMIFAITLPVTLALGALSWSFVESPCMREKRKLDSHRPISATATPGGLSPA